MTAVFIVFIQSSVGRHVTVMAVNSWISVYVSISYFVFNQITCDDSSGSIYTEGK